MTNNTFAAWVARYRDDPVLWVQEVLGADPDEWQVVVLREYAKGTRLISIRSAHGPGKTVVMSWMALHHIMTRIPQKTICTAPTSSQLFDALASEMKMWASRMPRPLQDLLVVKTDRIDLANAPSESFIAFSTSRAESPEAIQGKHSENMLILIDEASGVPEAVFEAGAGSMSGKNAITVMASNPTRSSGTFFDSHNKGAGSWFTVHVCADVPEASPSAYKSPRVDPAFVTYIEELYGRDSNAFRVRVLGEFPRSDIDTFFSFELVDGARRRDVQASPLARMVWGVDCARFGDDHSALCKRLGNVVPERVVAKNGLDVMQTSGWIFHEWNQTPVGNRPLDINVDSIGIGAGVVDRLRELGLPARGINVSESPSMTDQYINLRAELAGRCKEWLQMRDCKLPDDEPLCGELQGIKYTFTSSGKVQLESKDAMRKQKRGSPDRADALFLTFASDYGTLQSGWTPTGPWNSPIRRNLPGVYALVGAVGLLAGML